jgi:competence protein ComEC
MKLRTGYLISGIITGIIMLVSFILTQPDGKLHVVFCNVGQGDAAYIRFADGRDMLIDGGPNASVLSCLGRHMPFWDKTIDIVALTHPQNDHLGGLESVLDRYTVGNIVRSDVTNATDGFQNLMATVQKKNIPVKLMTAGDRITVDTTSLSVLWPSPEQMAPQEGSVLGAATGEPNDYSLVFALRYGTFDVLFPGDADSHVEAKYIQLQDASNPVEVLKVPHHGSKTSMTPDFLFALKPALAVISVGKNSYGHPSREAVIMLQNINSRVLRTDVAGDVEVVSDGRTWKVE